MSETEKTGINLKVTDLFGNEVYAHPRKRGRPPFQRTEENARKVSMLLALGWSNERIASCIKDPRTGKAISEPTLKRYFRSEMSERAAARDRLEARRIERMWNAAEAGNVGAERQLDRLLEKNDRMVTERSLGKPEVAAKPVARGKKEEREAMAEKAEKSLLEEIETEAHAQLKH